MNLSTIYTAAAAYVSDLDYITQVALYNGQPDRLEEHHLSDTPCVFIQLLPGQVQTLPGNVQRIQLNMTFYLVQDMLDSDDAVHLDVIDFLNRDLSGEDFTVDPADPILFSGLILESITPDYDHGKVIVHVLSYSCTYIGNNDRDVNQRNIDDFDPDVTIG